MLHKQDEEMVEWYYVLRDTWYGVWNNDNDKLSELRENLSQRLVWVRVDWVLLAVGGVRRIGPVGDSAALCGYRQITGVGSCLIHCGTKEERRGDIRLEQ
jgi:hypothetical protein